jgi:hypothetical protein
MCTRWYGWAMRSRLRPVKRVSRMIEKHWQGVLNAATRNGTNALSEGLNSKLQRIRRKACSYRNRQRLRHAIYFDLGGLDLSTRRATDQATRMPEAPSDHYGCSPRRRPAGILLAV